MIKKYIRFLDGDEDEALAGNVFELFKIDWDPENNWWRRDDEVGIFWGIVHPKTNLVKSLGAAPHRFGMVSNKKPRVSRKRKTKKEKPTMDVVLPNLDLGRPTLGIVEEEE